MLKIKFEAGLRRHIKVSQSKDPLSLYPIIIEIKALGLNLEMNLTLKEAGYFFDFGNRLTQALIKNEELPTRRGRPDSRSQHNPKQIL